PIFAWANAGVDLRGDLAAAVLSPISLGIILGLVLGKSIGITLFTWVTVKLGLGDLPIGVTWRHVYGGAWLAGIGFTLSPFIASANFTGERSEEHTSELQSRENLVCRLLLEKKKKDN